MATEMVLTLTLTHGGHMEVFVNKYLMRSIMNFLKMVHCRMRHAHVKVCEGRKTQRHDLATSGRLQTWPQVQTCAGPASPTGY